MAKKKKAASKAAGKTTKAAARRPVVTAKKTRSPTKTAKKQASKAAKPAKRPAESKGAKRPETKTSKAPSVRKEVLGEGNYTASREFRKNQESFVKANKSRIPALAKDAERALEGPEGAELRKAEKEARSHAHDGGEAGADMMKFMK